MKKIENIREQYKVYIVSSSQLLPGFRQRKDDSMAPFATLYTLPGRVHPRTRKVTRLNKKPKPKLRRMRVLDSKVVYTP